MGETVGASRDEQAAALVAVVLLAGSFLLFLLMLPSVLHHEQRFSPWIYLPGLLAFFLAVWKKADHVANLAIVWMSLFFMVDLVYGLSLFG
jgi:hypothetical protein